MKARKTYIIRHKETLKQWKGGKKMWSTPGHAKRAWNMANHFSTPHLREYLKEIGANFRYNNPEFHEQDIYEIVEVLNDSESLLKEACSLLKRTVEIDFIEYNIIYEFLSKIDKIVDK